MVRCVGCGKEILEEGVAHCDIAVLLCVKSWGVSGLCSACTDLWRLK